MKKIFFYCTAGSLALATACSTADTGTTADTSTYETSETVTAAGSTDDATMDTGTTGTTTTETETTSTTGTSTETSTTGTTETGSMGTTGTATGTATGTTTDMDADMTGEMATLTNLDDATFMMTAASSNMMEIEMGKMVAQKATNPEVKQFAQMMVDHHTKATQELKSVASQMNVTLPTTMMPMHKSMVDKLSDKSDAELEEKYMDTMETAHKMDIAMFEAKSQNATEASVKNFASKTLPTLKQHKEKANSIEDKVD
jgi:putative membrane protein